MKRKFEIPELEIISFTEEDVILTSTIPGEPDDENGDEETI